MFAWTALAVTKHFALVGNQSNIYRCFWNGTKNTWVGFFFKSLYFKKIPKTSKRSFPGSLTNKLDSLNKWWKGNTMFPDAHLFC